MARSFYNICGSKPPNPSRGKNHDGKLGSRSFAWIEWGQWVTQRFAGAVSIDSILYDFDRFLFSIAFVDRTGKQLRFEISRFVLEEARHVPRASRRLETFFMHYVRLRLAYN
jgi:hypothetical protein